MQVDVRAFQEMRQSAEPHAVLDVREDWEREICRLEGSLNVSLTKLPEYIPDIPKDKPLVVMCHHGMRSWHAVMWLRSQGFNNAVNLDGGIDAWARQIDTTMATY